jgi:beta-1,4-mannosyl-glycoprotein beta-1,4-N-acetylglucosaminyltransferase
MKIYDCFTFNNELDLLELRLKILDPVVDYFVLVEATKKHSGDNKPLFFEENKKRFKKWESKIIHVIVKDMPRPGKIFFKDNWRLNSVFGLGRWKPEIYQRNQIRRGLRDCRPEDIIMISDLDEIPNIKKIPELINLLKTEIIVSFNQKLYYYYLNGFANDKWYGTRACTFRSLKAHFGSKPDRVRRLRSLLFRINRFFGKKENIITPGGWHFSYIGDVKSIIAKISATSHSEIDKSENKDPLKIKERIESGKDILGRDMRINYVPVDSTFPDEIFKNKKKYSKIIKKV